MDLPRNGGMILKKEGNPMKKMTAIVTTLILILTLCGAALAEAPADDPALTPAASQPAATEEPADVSPDDLFSRISQGMDLLSGALSDGWDLMTDQIAAWIGEAEAVMNDMRWDDRVREAWETLKEGAAKQGGLAAEKLSEAYRTVRDWLRENGEALDQAVAETVDRVAAAAGVAEAKMAEWCRMMEKYMTEKSALVTEAVREAWTVIEQNAEEAGTVTREKLAEAYAVVRQWLCSLGETEDSDVILSLDEMSAL